MFQQPLDTARLRIRTFVETDIPIVCTYATDPAVMHYMEEGVQSVAQVAEFVGRNLEASTATVYALVLQGNAQLIGHLVFHPWFAPRTYEIGWVLHPAYQGQGYTTEGARALLRHGFVDLDLHRIIATCQPENVASYRVMEKIGMRREGHFQACIYRGDDTWWDEYFYAILARDWHVQQGPDGASHSSLRK